VRTQVLALALALGAGLPASSRPPAADPFAFFEPTARVTSDDRARLDRGDVVVRVLDHGSGEIATLAAVRVHADGPRLVAWTTDIVALKKSRYVTGIARFSDPPTIGDLRTLTLTDDDLNAIRNCRPASCDLKLAGTEMASLRQAAAAAGDDWKGAVQRAFRQVVLARARTYVADGQAALPSYEDRDTPVAPAAVFASLAQHSTFLTAHVPGFVGYLERYPEPAPPGVTSFLYWSSEMLGNRPTVSITHVAILQPDDESLPEAIVAGKQVFATHYTDGSLNITAIVRNPGGGDHDLVYINRSRVDVLQRWFGGLARMIIDRRIKGEASEILVGLRDRIESGPPGGGRP
jgi:hypothetical protein